MIIAADILCRMALAIAITASLLVWGIRKLHGPRNASFIWSLGIGAVRGPSLVRGSSPLNSVGYPNPDYGSGHMTFAVILANLPQAILSFLYLCYNNLFTSISLVTEWNSYCYNRKGLRVSQATGEQRSTHFLSLPFRLAIPLTIISGLFIGSSPRAFSLPLL